jgi:hypothetical protein
MLSYLAAQWCISDGMLRGARASTTSALKAGSTLPRVGHEPVRGGYLAT